MSSSTVCTPSPIASCYLLPSSTYSFFTPVGNSKEQYDAFTQKTKSDPHPLRDHVDSPASIASVSLKGAEYKQILSSPIVPLNYGTLRNGVGVEVLAPISEKMLTYQTINVQADIEYNRGQLREKPNVVLSVSGWDSIEVG